MVKVEGWIACTSWDKKTTVDRSVSISAAFVVRSKRATVHTQKITLNIYIYMSMYTSSLHIMNRWLVLLGQTKLYEAHDERVRVQEQVIATPVTFASEQNLKHAVNHFRDPHGTSSSIASASSAFTRFSTISFTSTRRTCRNFVRNRCRQPLICVGTRVATATLARRSVETQLFENIAEKA